MDVLLRKAELVLTEDPTSIGPKHASQIWGFLSKFIMLDRFIKALGGAEVYPGLSIPRTTLSLNYLGTGSKVSISLLYCKSSLTGLLDPKGA